MKVLFVVNDLRPGGAPRLALRIMAGMHARGVDTRLVILGSQRTDAEQVPDDGEAVWLDFDGNYRSLSNLLAASARLEKEIEEFRPDVVHSFLWISDVITAAAVKRRCPHVVYLVDSRSWLTSSHLQHVYRRWLTRWLLRKSNPSFLSVSRSAADFHVEPLKIARQNISVIPNAIDLADFEQQATLPHYQEELVLGICGRMDKEKRHQFLFETVVRCREQGIMLSLRVPGDGPLRAELEAFCRDNGLSDHVEFLGWISSLNEYYASLDLLVVPSAATEGMPTVILEAFASGCVVASTRHAAGDLIEHDHNGWLFDSDDSDGLLSIIKMAADKSFRLPSLAANARQKLLGRYTMDVLLDDVLAHYTHRIAEVKL